MKNSPNNSAVVQSQNIRDGALKQVFPPFYELASCIEVNPWHNHQSVFDHTLQALEAYEIFFDELNAKRSSSGQKLQTYFYSHVYGCSRDMLVRLAIIFHDAAKPQTWIEDPLTHETNCPGHELASSIIAQKYAKNFGLTTGATKIVSQLVLLHGETHGVFNQAMHDKGDGAFVAFQKTVGDVYMPLLTIAQSDMEGSYLADSDPITYKKRTLLYKGAVSRFASSL